MPSTFAERSSTLVEFKDEVLPAVESRGCVGARRGRLAGGDKVAVELHGVEAHPQVLVARAEKARGVPAMGAHSSTVDQLGEAAYQRPVGQSG